MEHNGDVIEEIPAVDDLSNEDGEYYYAYNEDDDGLNMTSENSLLIMVIMIKLVEDMRYFPSETQS